MKQGFTLLELSIVLVIIGLIIGGITVGADMIRSAELNSVVTDFNKYKVAINTFKLKYNALPGDMKNATAYWGAVSGSCNTVAGTGTQTCDGNGDGKVNNLYTPLGVDENWRFWEHMANSEIISGNYAGIPPASGSTSSAQSKLSNAYWHFYYVPSDAEIGKVNSGRHVFSLGTESLFSPNSGVDGVLSPPDLYAIESKIDDRSANSGIITEPSSGGSYRTGGGGVAWVNQRCSDLTIVNPDYRLSSDLLECMPVFDFD